ncbi:hypothetical protein [Paraburkholderia fungorum]|uniref:hypothetical protein n=1 Tax=Paraburkholderia fungorum TaxID=134537 RepID=UPI0038B8D24C
MKLPYFKLKEAFDEARDTFSSGSSSDKLSAVAKLVGKSAANVGMLAAEVGVEAVKRAPEITGHMAKSNLDRNSHLMTDEQRETAQNLVQAGKEANERRLEKEREEREREEQEREEQEREEKEREARQQK